MRVQDLAFHPPGVEHPLLSGISMDVPAHSLGLVIGRSGSGKTTLLQVLAGLCEQTSGTVGVVPAPTPGQASSFGARPSSTSPSSPGTTGGGRGAKFAARMAAEKRVVSSGGGSSGSGAGSARGTEKLLAPATLEQRMARVGLVFQFPERHFLGQDVFSELTFSWPREPAFFLEQQALRTRVLQVLQAVGLSEIDMSLAPWALSGGQQRRLALAIQLIRQPTVLLLDEPLAGLDWQARLEVVELLQRLKQDCSLVVVSHDLREVGPLVDCAWEMAPGGTLKALDSWPPTTPGNQ